MVNRNMQAKAMKANRQRAAYALDASDRASYLTTVKSDLSYGDMVAAFHAKKEAERIARAEVAANVRVGLGQSARVGLAAKYRR